MRRRYNPESQRTIFAPSRPNKRSRQDIAEMDAELTQRAKRLDGGYRPLQEEEGKRITGRREERDIQIGEYTVNTEEDNIIMREDHVDCRPKQLSYRRKGGPLYTES